MHPFQTRDEHSRREQVSVIVDHVVEVLMMYSFIWFCLSSSRVVVRVAVLVDIGLGLELGFGEQQQVSHKLQGAA